MDKAELAELEALRKRVAELEGAKPAAQIVPGRSRWLLTQPHYRNGEMYQAGQVIEIENEVPGRTWKRLELDELPAAPVEAPVNLSATKPQEGLAAPVKAPSTLPEAQRPVVTPKKARPNDVSV